MGGKRSSASVANGVASSHAAAVCVCVCARDYCVAPCDCCAASSSAYSSASVLASMVGLAVTFCATSARA